MANDEEVLASTVREYFLKNGGRVKRNDLFDHFRGQLDKFDDQGTSKNRFGDIVNSLASLQNIEGEKYFVLKKARNGTTPVLLRRSVRQVNQRKDKGVSLPASMRNFRFSTTEDASGYLAGGDNKTRPSPGTRARAGLRSDSHDGGMRRNNSDTSIVESGQTNDSGVDTAVSSLQSESPRGSRQSSFSKNSEYDRMSQNSGDTGISFNEDDLYEHDVPSHVLTSFEKSWMMSAMTGNRSEIICQLEEDRSIVKFKDFIMGTALHWAAKQGNEELVRLLVQGGADINTKSGYTPLHLATMHGKVNIIDILIDEYHANVHVRDHSGKEPKDVVTKNLSEQIKLKLAEPETAIALTEMAKKFPAINPTTDSSNASGFSRYMDPKDSPKLKPKLKAGASFRFLQKKPKKLRRSERPVIEHWDSSRQERLESTLESDEKELYKMQRSNTGSLFPNSFYAAKKASQSEQAEEKPDSVDAAGELATNPEDPRQRLLSRSYPESEFRNLARISEGEPQESSDEHRSPSVSLSNPSAVKDGQNVLGGKVEYSTVRGDNVLEAGPIGRRSHSENNLTKHASFQDELATSLTMDEATNGRPPSVFAEDASSLKQTMNPENGDEDSLRLRIDSSPGKGPLDPFKGEELATFMIVPNKRSGVSTQQDSKPSSRASTQPDGKSVDSSGKLNKVNGNLSSFGEEEQKQLPEAQPVYNNDKVISKFNNNYKQVSEILTSDEQKNTEVTPEEPTSPVRPPRKKDKKLKKSLHVEGDDIERTIYDFETGKEQTVNSASPNSKQNYDGVSSAYMADRNKGLDSALDYDIKLSGPPANWRASGGMRSPSDYKGNEMLLERKSQSSTSLNDFRRQGEQFNTNFDYTKRNSKGPVNQADDTNTRAQPYQDYTRRKSDGFAIHKAYSDGNMFNTRRKSEGFTRGAHERTGYEEFRKPSADYTRPNSEGFTDMRRTEGLRDELRPAGFTNQKEVSLDHPRRSSHEEVLKPDSEFVRRKSEGFVDQQRSGSFTDQRKLDGFTSQKEMSLDHPRRRTMHSLPPRTNQNESRHVLPDVLLDTSRRRASSGYTKRPQDDPGPSRDDFRSNTQVDKRVPPPYRPPPGLVKEGASEHGSYSEQGNRRPPTRPSYKPPPPPVAKEPPPYRKSQDFTPAHSLSNPDSRTGYPDPAPSSTRPSELSFHSSENLSNNTRSVSQPRYPPPIDPTAPPRKHRTSVSSEDTAYPRAELSPTAPPRKHRGSLPSTEDLYHPPNEVSPTAPPRKHRGNIPSEDLDYSPTELSSTAPPHKHRGSVPSSTEYLPTTTSRPSYPPPSLPSNVPPAPLHKSQGSADYTFGREVSLDHPKRRSQNYEPDVTTVIAATSYVPTEYNTQSSNYQRSEPKEYFPSKEGNFEGQFSNYRRSEPNEYNPTEYGHFQPRSSTYRRSEGNEYNRSDSSYPQTSSLQYPSDSGRNYPSEFSSSFEPTEARDQVDGYESRSIRPRSAVDTTTRDQSPPDEIVVARSVTSEPDRFTDYPKEFQNDRREPPDYIPIRKPQEISGDNIDRRNGTFAQPSYENKFDTVIMPKYEGYTETNTVLMPKYEGYTESNISRPEINVSRPEHNFVEPEFIVAKQMAAHEVVTEARPVARGSREDMDTLPGVLGQDMKNKWVSNSSDGSNESSENRSKYRMTSMI